MERELVRRDESTKMEMRMVQGELMARIDNRFHDMMAIQDNI